MIFHLVTVLNKKNLRDHQHSIIVYYVIPSHICIFIFNSTFESGGNID